MSSSFCVAALFVCVVIATFDSAKTYPSFSNAQRAQRSVDVENPEDVFRVLMKLAQDLVDSDTLIRNEKRGLDLGLSRGFSGQQAAKHLMGLAAANFANGPGRRRRDVDNQ